jgi:hypothetical protein
MNCVRCNRKFNPADFVGAIFVQSNYTVIYSYSLCTDCLKDFQQAFRLFLSDKQEGFFEHPAEVVTKGR